MRYLILAAALTACSSSSTPAPSSDAGAPIADGGDGGGDALAACSPVDGPCSDSQLCCNFHGCAYDPGATVGVCLDH